MKTVMLSAAGAAVARRGAGNAGESKAAMRTAGVVYLMSDPHEGTRAIAAQVETVLTRQAGGGHRRLSADGCPALAVAI